MTIEINLKLTTFVRRLHLKKVIVSLFGVLSPGGESFSHSEKVSSLMKGCKILSVLGIIEGSLAGPSTVTRDVRFGISKDP